MSRDRLFREINYEAEINRFSVESSLLPVVLDLHVQISNFTGVSDPYEEPLNPDLTVNTDQETVDESVANVVSKLEELGYLSR